MTQECKYFTKIVKGSFHQVNTSIFSSNSVGKQCVPNCATAALYTSIIPLYRWTSDILDNILKCGDKLYNDIHSGNDFLQVHEICKEIRIHHNLYAFQIRHEYFGQIHNQCALDAVNMTLEKATSCVLQQNQNCQWAYCILCVGNQNGATASLLCLSGNNCYIFDPHSRNSYGKPTPDGTSVLMMFQNRQKMISYLRNLYSLLKYPTTIKSVIATDIYSMCHIDFHIIDTTVQNYFLDQHYFAFCTRTEKGKNDTRNSESKVLCNDYQETFVSETVPQKKKRDRVKEKRDNDRCRIKQNRENIGGRVKQNTDNIRIAKRQKKDKENGKDQKDKENGKDKVLHNDYQQIFASRTVHPNDKGEVLDNDYQETFVSDIVLPKRKRDRVKENREKTRGRIKQNRENIGGRVKQNKDKIRKAKRQKKDKENGKDKRDKENAKGKVLDNDCQQIFASRTVHPNDKGEVLDNDYQETFVSDIVLPKRKRDRVKENREKTRGRIKQNRENIGGKVKQNKDKIRKAKRQKKDTENGKDKRDKENGKDKVLDKDYQ